MIYFCIPKFISIPPKYSQKIEEVFYSGIGQRNIFISKILRTCCETMKQKLQEKKYSYKNLYLSEIQENRIFSNLSVKCSLIGLSIAKFFGERESVNSFYDRTITLSIDLRNLKGNNTFILKSLMLLILSVFISVHHSNATNIVERRNFGLTKVKKQDYSEKNYQDIYKKSFRNLKKKGVSSSTVPCLDDQVFLGKIEIYLLEREKDKLIHDSNFPTNFFTLNDDYIWIRREILQNLQRLGESSETLVKSSFSLGKEGHLYFSKYMRNYISQFLTKNGEEIEPKIFEKKDLKYLFDGLKNPKLCLTLENILSNAVYKFSRYLRYKARESKIQIENRNSLIKEMDKNIYILYLSRSINLNQFNNLFTHNYNFGWMTKISYFGDNLVSKRIFRKRTFLNKILSPLDKKSNSLFYPFEKPFESKYIINDLFSQPKIKKMNLKFFLFPEPLLINDVIQTTALEEKISKIPKNLGRIRELKNNMESDDVKILSRKVRKYYSNFFPNRCLPPNLSYNTIYQNSSPNKKIGYRAKKKINGLLLEFSNLLILFSRLRKTSLINCINLKEYVVVKTKELDRFIDQSNETKDPDFSKNILSISRKSHDISNNRSELEKNYLLLKSLIDYYSHKYFSKSSNQLFLKLFDSGILYNKIFNKYSIPWKGYFQQSFVHNIVNEKYKKIDLEVHYWLYKMESSSKKIVFYNFSMRSKVTKILEKFFQNSESENIDKISTKIYNIDVDEKNIYKQTLIKNYNFFERDINNLIVNLPINETNYEIKNKNLLNTFLTKNMIWLNYIKNEILFFNCNNDFPNFQLNYNLLFDSRKSDVGNDNTIYFQFLTNFSKYNKFLQISIKKNYQFFLSKFGKTKYLSFFDSYERISKQIDFSFSTKSKIHFSKRVRKFISAAISEIVETDRIGKYILPDLDSMRVDNHYNILRYESLTRDLAKNNSLFRSTSKIFLESLQKYSNLKIFKPKNEGGRSRNIDKIFDKFDQLEVSNFFEKDLSVKDFHYRFWFFTSEWWEYGIHIFTGKLEKRFIIIGSYLEYLINKNIQLIRSNLVNLYGDKEKISILDSKWNSRLSPDHTGKIIFDLVSPDFQLITNWNNLHWAILGLITLVLLFHKNDFSIFIGSDSISVWTHFENIKYLTDNSRASYLTELLHRDKTQLNETDNLLIFFVSNLKHYARNIQFYLVTRKKLKRWLLNNKSLDLSRRKRNLLVQSLITPTRLKEYGFKSYYRSKTLNKKLFGYHSNPQQGLYYLRYVSRILEKKLVNYSVHRADKWIFFASLQKIISSQTLRQTKQINSRFQKISVPLQLGLSCSKGILLIGPIETGRSYLMKNLAADSSVPLLGISINKLMYNKPDVITENWMNILIESLRRLNLILDLARGMSPCIIWIRNIHQLDVDRLTQNIESDPTFLLGILLKHFQTDSLGTRTRNNIIMIGSTHVPKKVDPSLISPDRLDRILNIRLLNTYQRKNQFPILLNRHNLRLNKNLLHLNEFGSRTMGYNIRDLVAFTNEVSLVSLTKNKSLVYDDIIRLAFNRQVLAFGHTNTRPNYQQNFKILLYKIGKVVIQNMYVKGFATNPLNIGNYLWKKNFYYLSKWYLEPSIDDSIVKEFTILVHVLGCSSGIAARDSWFLLEKDSKKSLSLDKSIENDLDLAFSILETFSSDFPWLETCKSQFITYEREKLNTVSTNFFFDIMHKGIFAMADKTITNTQNNYRDEYLLSRDQHGITNVSDSTSWSPRFWRLNFCRSQLFSWIKRPNDFEFFHTFEFPKKNNFGGKNHHDQPPANRKEQLFYERILPRVRKRNVEELESQFENILLEEQFEILGFFDSATQYRMEHQLNDKPRLFIGKRVLWDPTGSFSQLRHFVFSSREFFVDEEMLRRLYITYGVRRERERSLSSHRIKRFFMGRGYNKDLINKLSVRWWNQLPVHQKQNIYTLKRIEKIGIRLERPQIFTPVYLYQRWLIENIPGKFSRLDLLTHRDRWIRMNKILSNDSLTYNILLESYQYLLEFFPSNKVLLDRMTKTLLKKKWIFQNEIVDLIYSIKNLEL
jgi:AAA+ superfamily predicted ATPase